MLYADSAVLYRQKKAPPKTGGAKSKRSIGTAVNAKSALNRFTLNGSASQSTGSQQNVVKYRTSYVFMSNQNSYGFNDFYNL